MTSQEKADSQNRETPENLASNDRDHTGSITHSTLQQQTSWEHCGVTSLFPYRYHVSRGHSVLTDDLVEGGGAGAEITSKLEMTRKFTEEMVVIVWKASNPMTRNGGVGKTKRERSADYLWFSRSVSQIPPTLKCDNDLYKIGNDASAVLMDIMA